MGVSKLAATSAERKVVLTSHGRAVAVVDSADRLDDEARVMREAAAAVLDATADDVSERGDLLSLDEVCARIGVDAANVRAKAAEKRNG